MGHLKNIPNLRFPEFSEKWDNKKLGEVAEISSGGTPSRTNPNYWNGNIPWVSTTLIDFNFIDDTEECITEEGLKNSSAKLFPKGTLLMAMYGQGKTRGKVSILNIEAATNQACGAITTNNEILNSLFTFQNLAKRYVEIRDLSNQGGQENLSGGIIKSINISFPSLHEQQKIASFLSSVDEKLQALKKKKSLLEQYKKGVMQKIFTQELRFRDDDGNEFSEWEVKIIGEVCDIVGGGTPETNVSEYWQGKIQWFTPTEIKSDYVSKSIRTITEIGFKKSSAKLLPKGTILLTTRATIGEAAVALEECSTNQGFQSLIVKDNMNNIYVFNWIKQNKFELTKRANGSTFPEISKTELEQIEIQIPSLLEQTKIANFLSAIDKKMQHVQAQIEKMEMWKKGLLQKMFV
jgi:type I restriction enzyme, S subunit